MRKTIVFNTVSGPGAGKSTLSHGLMAFMKGRKHRCEMVQEYAKELSFQRDWVTLADQGAVTKEQDRRLRNLLGHVDYIIHDTALPLGIVYSQGEFSQHWFHRRVWELFDGYTNFNCFVIRTKEYEEYGRNQKEDEARALDRQIYDLFAERIHLELPGEDSSVQPAYEALTAFARQINSP